MKFLLWGEQLFKTWEKHSKGSSHCAAVRNWDELTRSADWDGLVIDQSAFQSVASKIESLAKPVAVLVADGQTPTQSALAMPFSADFWERNSAAVLTSFTRFVNIRSENTALQKNIQSIGASQSQLADSTALLVQKLEQHIQIAAEIQKALLPSTLPKIPGVTLGARFFPSHGVGGDYYDVFEFGDKKRFGFLLADSQTHGMAAALLSALLKLRGEQIREDFQTAGDFLLALGQHVQSEVPVKAADLHLFYGILDRSSLTFRFATAGGLRPMIWRGGKLASLPVKNAPPLNDTALGSFPENEWSLEPGDYVALVTRGLEPIAAPKSMEAWIEDRIRKHDNWPDMQDIQNELAAVASDMSALTDDITLLQLTVDPRALYLKK